MMSMSGRSLLARRLTKDHNGSDAETDSKGPFGLITLYQPQDSVIADLIFVHGLRGGSRSTWTKSDDPSLYWIKEWLPKDPGFQDVRIHSFGYNSNWYKSSVLNVQDFAKALLGSIQDCPMIPRSSKVSTHLSFPGIIFTMHSYLQVLCTDGNSQS